jgi:pyruvate dehydrogenase E2 component (dihydrolipoamide acetyltransferase)
MADQGGAAIGGRLVGADLRAKAVDAASGTSGEADLGYTDTPLKGIRKVIAAQMMRSHLETAAFTLNAYTGASRLLALRAAFKKSSPSPFGDGADLGLSKITINDLVLFAVSRVLPRFPFMNGQKLTIETGKAGETGQVFRQYGPASKEGSTVHLGCAVNTERGLMVPVIRNAHTKTLAQISAEAKDLAQRCREGKIKPEELRGGTFTVTNLGNTGIESFTPVINIPEVAILGVCSIMPKPVEREDGSLALENCLPLSLTIDHAVVDGAPAAQFLKALCEALREIDILMAL